MIAILLNDASFEQDIRELLMAFYPGETFTHKEEEAGEADLIVRGVRDGNSFSLDVTPVKKEAVHFALIYPDFSNRFETKNEIKQTLYRLLSAQTGRELPWGTLTGIRPTKIALTKLYDGWTDEQIETYMRETYFTSKEKIDLSIDVAERERRLLSTIDYENGYSLYVGIPFCPTTCLYCSFTSFPIVKWEKRMDLYKEALFKEMEYVAEQMKDRPLSTIYFGGGTPTSLNPQDLDEILTKVEELFPVEQAVEFTVESGRPDSITREKLQVLRNHGISRISINPQTMKQATLDLIGRRHTVEDVKEKFLLARTRRLAPQHLINIGVVFACHCLTSPAPLLERALKAQHLRLCLAGVLVARLTEHHPRRLEPQLRLHGRVGCHLGQLLEDARLFALKVHHVPRSRYEST